jgi:hypothetical protein
MMPSRQRRLFATVACVIMLAACSSNPNSTTSTNSTSSLIPDRVVTLGPSVTYPLEKLVYWGAYVGIAYLILDPFAPNWEIQETRFPENHVHFFMTMKRYYSGGAGEARVIFNRRAKELMRAGGFGGCEVVEYTEGMESSMLGAQRTVEGVIRLTKTPG